MWIQIRLVLQEQSDLGPHCLSMRLQIFLRTTKNIHFVIMRFKGICLSKALTCMIFFLYKQKLLFYQGDGYLWLYCCMNNLYISQRSHHAQHTAFEQSTACLSGVFELLPVTYFFQSCLSYRPLTRNACTLY